MQPAPRVAGTEPAPRPGPPHGHPPPPPRPQVHLGQESAEEADGQPADQFLGLLYVTEEYSVYGYLTNTRAKILLVVEAHLAADESELRARCLALHKLYAHAVASPFRDDGDRLDTPGFCDRARAALGVS